jgi:hypothetical protein
MCQPRMVSHHQVKKRDLRTAHIIQKQDRIKISNAVILALTTHTLRFRRSGIRSWRGSWMYMNRWLQNSGREIRGHRLAV